MAIAVRTISTPARDINQVTGGSTNYTITSTTAGDLLIACLAWFNAEAAVVTGITGGGTWAAATSLNLDANSHIAIWYAHNVTGGVTTLSVTMNGDGSPSALMQLTVIHCSGAATSSALDVTPTPTTGTGLTPSITSGTLAQADEIVVQMNSHTGADLLTMVEDVADGFSEANQNLDNDDGQCFEAQYKVTTETTSLAVAATYNASRSWGAILASFKGAATGTTISPPAGALTLTGLVPSLALGVGLGLGSLVFTGLAPAVVVSGATTINVPAGSLQFTGLAPSSGFGLALPAGSLTFTGLAPSISGATAIAVPAGSVTFTGQAPTRLIDQPIAIPAGSLTFDGQFVAVTFGGPAAGSLVFTGLAPTVSISGQTTIAIPVGTLTYTGLAPASHLDTFIGVPAGSLVWTGLALSIAGAETIAVPAGSLSLTGLAPTVHLDEVRAIPAGTLTFTGQVLTVLGSGAISPGAGSIAFTGLAPTVKLDLVLPIPVGSVVFTGQAPDVVGAGAIPIPAGTLTLTGLAPSLRYDIAIATGLGSLAYTGQAPALGISYVFQVPAGALTFTGTLTSLLNTAYTVPTSGVLTTRRVDPIRTTEELL